MRAQRPEGGPVVTEEVEAAELSALQEDLDRRRLLLRRERESDWRQRSQPEITRVMHAKLRAASASAATRRFKALKSRRESAALAALYPDRFLAAASSSGTPPTVKKKRTARADKADTEGEGAAPPGRRGHGEKEVRIAAYAESSGVHGHAAPRRAAAPGRTCAVPPARVERRTLLAGMRVRAFYRRGGTKSQTTDAGVITRAPDGDAGRVRAGGGGRASPGGLRTSRSLSPVRTHTRLGVRSLPSAGSPVLRARRLGARNSVSPGGVRRGCVEVLFDDGAVQDVPVEWVTPLDLVPRDVACRVVCMCVCVYARIYVCTHICIYVICMYVCMYVCMYRQTGRRTLA